MAPSLRRNVVWTSAGSLIFSLSQWGALIAIAKISGARAVGDWNLALAVTGPVFVFALFKLRALQATDARREFQWSDYAGVRTVAMLAAFVVSAGFGAFAYGDDTVAIVAAVAAMKVFDGGSDLVYGHLQRDERMRDIARSQVGRGASALVVGVAVFVITESVVSLALASAAVYAMWLAVDLRVLAASLAGERMRPRLARGPVIALMRTAAPLGVVTAIGSLQLNVPRYFLEAYVGRAELGVFGSLQQLMFVGAVIVSAIANAAVARMARYAADQQWPAFTRLLRSLLLSGMGLGLAAVVLSALIGAPVLELLYSAEIARHSDLLIWLAASSGLLWSYLFLGTALDAMRSFKVQPWIFGASTITITVASAVLVPRYGLRGAAWALLVGYGVECSLFVIAVAVPLRRALRQATP